MNIITRTYQYLLAKTTGVGSASFNAMDHDMVRRVFGGMGSTAGKTVNEETAGTLSTVWACWRIIAETIGSSPAAFYEKDATGNMTKVPDYPLASVLINQPNADMTGVEYREAKALNLCQAGNAYSLVDRLGGEAVSLYPLRARDVKPKRNRESGAVSYDVNERGKWVELPQEKIWHVKGFGGDGLVGLSPLAAAREAIGFALATEEFGARFFAQGGKPSGVVTVPNFLNKEQREVARENLRQMLGGMGNAHKFALFEGGMKPEAWGDMPLKDMEMVLLRQFSVPEICRFYRIPPHMVADLSRATFSNIEQQSQEFVQYALLPYFTRLEASAQRWLIPTKDRGKIFLRFNADALLRGDSAGRAALYPVLLQNGVMTRNEVRAKENLNSVTSTEMNAHTVQSNMIRIDDLDAVAEAMRAPKGPPGGAFKEPPPPTVGKGDTTVNAHIALPSSLAHEVEHKHAGIAELVKRVEDLAVSVTNSHVSVARKSEDLTDEVTAGNQELLRELTTSNRELMKQLVGSQATLSAALTAAAKQRYRMVLDKKGDPVGREPVAEGESMHPRTID